MGINRVTRKGKECWEVRKRWPDRTEYRRFFPGKTKATNMYHRIESSILDGSWREFRVQLMGKPEQGMPTQTVSELAEVYLEHCRSTNRRPDFKEQAFVSIRKIVGAVPIQSFSIRDADRFVQVRRSKVKPATVNRGLAVLKNMLTFAVERGYLTSNPLRGYKKLAEEKRPLRIMTVSEERALIEAVAKRNPIIGAFCALLGETGLRKSEALNLKWEDINWRDRRLTVTRSKAGDPRYVPLTEYAESWLQTLHSRGARGYVFSLRNGQRINDPRYPFECARDEIGLTFVKGFHDFRHYRATQWLARGVDVRTVSHLLGHHRIETTMRYLHLIPDHADRAVRAAEQSEREELAQAHVSSRVA